MKKYINLAIFIAFAVLIVWVNLLRYQVRKLREIEPSVVIQRDTIRDTIRHPYPVAVISEIVVDNPISIPVEKLVFIGDSLILERERKTYKDSTYKAVVSGFQPSLDYIEVYQKTITNTITKTVRPQRWGVGVSMGYGIHLHQGKVQPGPYVGVGVYYNLYNLRK